MKEKFIIIALAIAAIALIGDALVESNLKHERPLDCEYNVLTETRLCK